MLIQQSLKYSKVAFAFPSVPIILPFICSMRFFLPHIAAFKSMTSRKNSSFSIFNALLYSKPNTSAVNTCSANHSLPPSPSSCKSPSAFLEILAPVFVLKSLRRLSLNGFFLPVGMRNNFMPSTFFLNKTRLIYTISGVRVYRVFQRLIEMDGMAGRGALKYFTASFLVLALLYLGEWTVFKS